MYKRLLLCVVSVMHLTCLGAAGSDDVPMTLWWQAELCNAVAIVALPGVVSEAIVTKTNLVCDKAARSLTVKTAVVVHPNNRFAEIIARHVAGIESFEDPHWLEQTRKEIYPTNSSNSAQSPRKQIDAIRPTVLALIKLIRTKDHPWPRYQIHIANLGVIARCKRTEAAEQLISHELFSLTPGKLEVTSFSRLPHIKPHVVEGEIDKVRIAWLGDLLIKGNLGIRLNYCLLNQGYNELLAALSDDGASSSLPA